MTHQISDEDPVQLGDLSADIAFLTRTARAHMRNELNLIRQETGIEPGEIGVLKLIKANPGMSQNQLADTVVIKKSAVTKTVQTLLAKGLIARKRQPEDKRFKSLTLTAEGEKWLEFVNSSVNELHEQWFAGFTAQERLQLCRLMLKMVGNFGAADLSKENARD